MSIKAKDTARKLDISNVYINASSSGLRNEFDPLMPNQVLSGQYAINTIRIDLKTVTDEDSNTTYRFLRYYIQANMRYIVGEPSEDEINNDEWVKTRIASEITAIYCVEYSIKPDTEISEEEKIEFGKINAPYHVWPFWREYCQSTCNRMNLPTSIVPMLIIDNQPKNEPAKNEQAVPQK